MLMAATQLIRRPNPTEVSRATRSTLVRPSVRHSRIGRPRGSTGSQIQRIKHRVASLVVLGKRNTEIAQALGVCSRTIRLWLRHPDVKAEIAALEAQLRQREAHLMAGLVRRSVQRLRRIVRYGDDETALAAIELIWTASGRLPQNRST